MASDGQRFRYALPDQALQFLSAIDRAGGGRVEQREPLRGSSQHERYMVSSLMEESIASSQLEGAAITRADAKDMLRQGRAPRTTSERMIVNNFQAIQWIREHRSAVFSPELILELHAVLGRNALDVPGAEGRLRRADEQVTVVDASDEPLHVPPAASELPERLEAMCAFANGETGGWMPEPVRAILLHFWLAYDHPFVDGNGRTARGLFYWLMLQSGYWICEYISISRLLKQAPARYTRSFLLVETDDCDTTYFLLHQLKILDRAIRELWQYVDLKQRQVVDLEDRLQRHGTFNQRQLDIMSRALRVQHTVFTYESHRASHGIVRQTARNDLLGLAEAGLLVKSKRGKQVVFRPPPDLHDRIRR